MNHQKSKNICSVERKHLCFSWSPWKLNERHYICFFSNKLVLFRGHVEWMFAKWNEFWRI